MDDPPKGAAAVAMNLWSIVTKERERVRKTLEGEEKVQQPTTQEDEAVPNPLYFTTNNHCR